MKLLSATVRNYRIHKETTVSLGEDMVLLHGPNESGKSTLAEAIHRAFFLKAKGDTSLHKAMESRHGGTPQVELTFEAKGKKHTLTKSFGKGNKGKTVLQIQGAETLNEDAAGEYMASLLHVEGAVSGGGIENKMKGRWAHLWVWQGESHGSPLHHLAESAQQLRGELQRRSGQDILSSPTDNALIDSLQAWAKENYIKDKQPRAGSPVARLTGECEALQAQLQAAAAKVESLRDAAKRYLEAEADRIRHQQNLETSEQRRQQVTEELKKVERVRFQLERKSHEYQNASKALEDAEAIDREIHSLEKKLDSLEKKAAPGGRRLEALATEIKDLRQSVELARKEREEASAVRDQLRREQDLWIATGEILKATNAQKEAEKHLRESRQLQEQVKALRDRLAPLRDFTKEALAELEKRERKRDRAKLTLDSFSMEIEVLESEHAVSFDGQQLPAGSSRRSSQTGELHIGQNTRIRLSPGGARDLEEARRKWESAGESLKESLRQCGAESVAQARQYHHARESIQQDLDKLLARIEDKNPAATATALDEIRQSLLRYQSRRRELLENTADPGIPPSLSEVEDRQESLRRKLDVAESTYKEAQTRETARREKLRHTEEEYQQTEQRRKKEVDEIRDLQSQRKLLLEKNGEQATRARKIEEARKYRDRIAEEEKAERRNLQKLGADALTIESEQLQKAIQSARQNLADARDRRTRAQTELSRSGSNDPESERKEIEANLQRSRARLAALERKGQQRLDLLHRLEKARQETNAAMARPLEEAVTPYLEILFGSGSPRLTWSEDGSQLKQIEIDRTDSSADLFAFDRLSHGTREQVALALRLAVAGILAGAHDGQLPLVLDDAFTHADQQRIARLKTMLYRASQHGLQILLLSCHPEHYHGLAGKEVRLG